MATKKKAEEAAEPTQQEQPTQPEPVHEAFAPKVIKNVVIPPVIFPERAQQLGKKPETMEELKKVIAENATSQFTELQLILMPHYKIDDQRSSKQVKAVLRELVAEKKIIVDSDAYDRLGTAHYPDTTTGKTHYWLLKDVSVKIKLA